MAEKITNKEDDFAQLHMTVDFFSFVCMLLSRKAIALQLSQFELEIAIKP